MVSSLPSAVETCLESLVAQGGVVVLSGAGLSTESGIPDYRGATGAAARTYTPMTYQTFVGDELGRRRYWARSHLGWQKMAKAQPNAGHHAVAKLESAGLVAGVITQNVDGLHTLAGSRSVIDLHGRLDRVICLSCARTFARADVHELLTAANPSWEATITAINPDGDVEFTGNSFDDFVVVNCPRCNGLLKPDVVYFGENVPVDRVALAYDWVANAKALLVLGSSLYVFSGRRFVMRAAQDAIPVAIVNEGSTKCDELASVRIHAPLGATLSDLVRALEV